MNSLTSSPGVLEVWDTEDRMIPIMRIVLALSAQLIIVINPTQPVHTSRIVLLVLGLFTVYSILLYSLSASRRHARIVESVRHWAHWIDLAWCAVLVMLSGGINSIFFIGFLFPMLVASFRWGFVPGLRVTIISALTFVAAGIVPPPGPMVKLELNRLLLKSSWLLGLGYMMAHWGASQITLKRRLQFIQEVTDFPIHVLESIAPLLPLWNA